MLELTAIGISKLNTRPRKRNIWQMRRKFNPFKPWNDLPSMRKRGHTKRNFINFEGMLNLLDRGQRLEIRRPYRRRRCCRRQPLPTFVFQEGLNKTQ